MDFYLSYRLDILSNAAKSSVAGIYDEQLGLDIGMLRLLRNVNCHPGVQPSEVADISRLDRPKTSRLLRRLTDLGLIVRGAGDWDGRQVRLYVSPQGKAVIERANVLSSRLEEAFLAPLTPEEKQVLITALGKLTEWVQSGRNVEKYQELLDDAEAKLQVGE